MLKDAGLSDCLEENLEYLEKEIAAIEKDCIAYAHVCHILVGETLNKKRINLWNTQIRILDIGLLDRSRFACLCSDTFVNLNVKLLRRCSG